VNWCRFQNPSIFPYLQPIIAESTAFVKCMPKANMCKCKFGSLFTGRDGAQLKREFLFLKIKFFCFTNNMKLIWTPRTAVDTTVELAILSVCVAARVVQVYKPVGLLHFGVKCVVLHFVYLIGCTYVDGNVTLLTPTRIQRHIYRVISERVHCFRR